MISTLSILLAKVGVVNNIGIDGGGIKATPILSRFVDMLYIVGGTWRCYHKKLSILSPIVVWLT